MDVYDQLARYYDKDFGNHTDDIHFYREMARRSGGPILELMCGTGRVILPLAEAGYTVTGVDSSARMLAIAQAKFAADRLAQRATLIQGDVRTVDLPQQTFALAFLSVNSFMHLEQIDDQLTALVQIRQTLQPDGVLLLDLFNPDLVELAEEDNRLVLETQYLLEGRQVLKFAARQSDLATQTRYITYLYEELDAACQVTRQVVTFRLRWFYRYELEHLLARAGFFIQSLYGSYNLDEYHSTSEQLIVLATPDVAYRPSKY